MITTELQSALNALSAELAGVLGYEAANIRLATRGLKVSAICAHKAAWNAAEDDLVIAPGAINSVTTLYQAVIAAYFDRALMRTGVSISARQGSRPKKWAPAYEDDRAAVITGLFEYAGKTPSGRFVGWQFRQVASAEALAYLTSAAPSAEEVVRLATYSEPEAKASAAARPLGYRLGSEWVTVTLSQLRQIVPEGKFKSLRDAEGVWVHSLTGERVQLSLKPLEGLERDPLPTVA